MEIERDKRHAGIMPALLTPFDSKLGVDYDELARTTGRLAEAGVSGLVSNGTLAEAQSLTEQEQRRCTQLLVESANGEFPIIVGVSSQTTAESVRLSQLAAEDGASGILCLPPLSYHASSAELEDFFGEIGRISDLPMMIYNNPSSAKNDLSPELVSKLSRLPGIRSVKECSGDARRIAAITSATDDDFDVLVGGDDWALEGFAAGAIGWVSGVANIAPQACVRLLNLVGDGKLEDARELYKSLLPLARLDMKHKLVQYFKGALDRSGLYGGPTRPPRQPLEPSEAKMLDEALDSLKPATVNTLEKESGSE